MKELMEELQNLRKNTNGNTSVIKSIEMKRPFFPSALKIGC